MGAKFKSLSIFVLLTLAVTSLFIPQASASTVPVQLYGPEQFTRDPGSPQTVTRDFTVQRLVAQSYTMQVQNGSMEGDSRISSAVVKLNGSVVLKQNDFNQNVYYLEKPVVVLSTNTFEIKLNSMPTSYITVTIVGNYLPVDVDDDGDGFTENEGDCNDADSFINPSAVEVCDYVDNNCDGQTDGGVTLTFYLDADADTYGLSTSPIQECSVPPGYAEQDGDCDDTNAMVNPGTTEVCDSIDNNCDASVDEGFDLDGDGVTVCAGDCDDSDQLIYPGAVEVCLDLVDNNCDGQVDEGCLNTYYMDADGDGYGDPATTIETPDTFPPAGYVADSSDCDDTDTSVNPAAQELCWDGTDNNCDGQTDPSGCYAYYCADSDGDGYGDPSTSSLRQYIPPPFGWGDVILDCSDCNDNNRFINPGATEICDNYDNNCDGTVNEGFDLDGDGYATCTGDCDDTSASINPAAVEICDDIDNNCNNQVDEGLPTTVYYLDSDGDGFGISFPSIEACGDPPSGYISISGDCNDSDPGVNPGAVEVCDSVDNNCDGANNEGIPVTTYYFDGDGDGYGRSTNTYETCGTPPTNYVPQGGDCDDLAVAVNPGTAEVCDSIDNNCDGAVDEGFDLDADGYTVCAGDCDDANASLNPGVAEVCDGIDNNCNNAVDEGLTQTYYPDADGDGWGVYSGNIVACTIPAGYADQYGDCDDSNPLRYPTAVEVCDGIDNNCNYAVDEGFDLDGDGYTTCVGDCDDASALVNPGTTEICDSIDNNCDGFIDEGVILTFYSDADADGYGTSTETVQACTAPSGYVAISGDCDDTAALVNPGAAEIICDGVDNNCDGSANEGSDLDADGYTTCAGDCDDTTAAINPGAAEVCDLADNNCDGTVDEGVTLTFYTDADSDGYGIFANTTQACSAPAGFAALSGDCDDTVALVNPGAAETCNTIDDNCDGSIDEGFDIDADGYTTCAGDCDDTVAAVNPAAVEVCDAVDNNCDGTTDPGCLTGIIADPGSLYLSGAGTAQQLLVTGYYYDGSSADLTHSSTGTIYTSSDQNVVTVNADGFVTAVGLGNTTVTAVNSGFSSNVNVTVWTLPANYQAQPEGSFGTIYEDLVPPDVTLDSYDPQRFSIITGFVEARGGLPLADVTIAIHGHPEFGSVFTDSTGRFSIPVEGEDTMTVVYTRSGMLEVHRKVFVPWNDIAVAETITMILQDTVSTQVAFDGNPATVYTHKGTETADAFGLRALTAVITGDNRAYYLNSVGTQVFLPTITVRATEYDTPESMPAILPPASGFTYCVEMTLDETEHIQFEKPVAMFLDNFLGFDVGTPVPVGYYDRDLAVWVPVDDGVVIRLLDTDLDGVVDALDTDGDNLPDDLNSNGSFADEVQGLEDPLTYPPGATLWRATVGHFTSFDLNYAVKPANSEHTTVANLSSTDKNDSEPQTCPLPQTGTGSSVDHRSRVLQEDIPIPGTGLTLHYKSDRVDDYQTVITIPASGDTVPAPLKRIVVRMTVAGRVFESTFGPLPNQMATFVWDGLDYQGRRVKGDITANIRIGFVYDGVYYIPAYVARSFGLPAGIATTIPARQEVTLWTDETVQIRRDGGDIIADGWTVSAHHSLVPYAQNVLSKGDGSVLNFVTRTMDLIVGDCPPGGVCTQGYSGDNGPAKDALIRWPMEVAAAGDGSIYINHSGLLRKIDPQGIITTYHPDIGYIGDMDFDQEGNIIFTDGGYVKKLDTSGNITTLAGTGVAGFSGDNGPAVNAAFNQITGIALDDDGNIYIVDTHNQRVRRIDSDGIITTVAGTGALGYNGDNIRATSAKLFYPTKIATDSAGNFYIADGQNYRVRKVSPDGIITTVAGNGIAPSRYGTADPIPGDGGPAVDSEVFAQDVAVDAAGNLYILHSEWTNRYMIRMVTPSGLISIIAGGPLSGPPGGDGGPATDGRIINGSDMTVSGSGDVYISSYWHHIVSEVSYTSDFSGFLTAGELGFAEEGGIGHIFSESGLHSSTIDLNSGVELLNFGYDTSNRLASITDRFGNATTIQRDASGVPTSITSPDGIVTSLTVDADNNLRQVTYPDSSFYAMDYTPGGLMTDEYHPDSSRFTRLFDANGRVTDANDPEGGHWTFDRQTAPAGTATVSVLSGEGDQITYVDNSSPTGEFSSVITAPDGSSSTVFQPDGALSVTQLTACGMEITSDYGLDPEFRFRTSKGSTTTVPSGLSVSTGSARIYSDTNTDGSPDLITDTVTTNGKVSTVVNDTLTGRVTATSPTGRTVMSYYDPASLLTSRTSTPGLFDTDFVYDLRGRLTDVTVGTRTTSFAYDTNGYLDFMTTPDNRTFDYTYDVMGRLTDEVRPDGAGVSYSYDNNGNMTVLVNPNFVSHSFSYTANDQRKSYSTPISGGYSYLYDRDRRLSSVTYPSGQSISNFYLDGNLDSTVTPEGTISYSYDCGGKLGSVTKGTESTSYTYDGSLLLSDTRLGTVNEVIDYTYDTDMRVGSIGYAGGVESFVYDNDGLLTNAGPFTITRNVSNGLPEAVSDGTVVQGRVFSVYGEVDGVDYTVGGAAPYSWSVTRDLAGRITQKVENIGIDTITWDYTYDLMGRLETVYKDNALAEAYSYDDNGNRLSENNILRGVSRSYTNSIEDHVLTAGADSYVFDVDGFLTTRTLGGNTDTFDYSSRGELLSVSLTSGNVITYDHDPLGRRIAKRVNGTITEKYLWQDATTLLAVYDGADTLIQRFSYADGRMPVSMTYQGAVYYLTFDQVGSLRAVTDNAGNIIKRIDYDSFGNILSDSNSTFTVPFGFAGGLHDRDTGLVRFGARDYDPAIGKWTAKDPIDFRGGGLNFFSYAVNNPINIVDTNGLAPLYGYEENYYSPKQIKNIHFGRNDFNKKNVDFDYAINNNWTQVPPEDTAFHAIGTGNENNIKYLSPINKSGSSSEAVFYGKKLVTSPENLGTYNFIDPRIDAFGHIFFDTIPYLWWGNSSSDPTTRPQRFAIAANNILDRISNSLFAGNNSCGP